MGKTNMIPIDNIYLRIMCAAFARRINRDRVLFIVRRFVETNPSPYPVLIRFYTLQGLSQKISINRSIHFDFLDLSFSFSHFDITT